MGDAEFEPATPLLVSYVKAFLVGTALSENPAYISGFCRFLRRRFPALS